MPGTRPSRLRENHRELRCYAFVLLFNLDFWKEVIAMKVRHSSRATQGFWLLFGLAVGSSAFGSSLIENVTQTDFTQAEQAITINRDKPNNIL